MARYGYMVDTRGPKPDLVRYSGDGYERYTPQKETEWSGSPFLDELAWGGGDFAWFDDISASEAEMCTWRRSGSSGRSGQRRRERHELQPGRRGGKGAGRPRPRGRR